MTTLENECEYEVSHHPNHIDRKFSMDYSPRKTRLSIFRKNFLKMDTGDFF